MERPYVSAFTIALHSDCTCEIPKSIDTSNETQRVLVRAVHDKCTFIFLRNRDYLISEYIDCAVNQCKQWHTNIHKCIKRMNICECDREYVEDGVLFVAERAKAAPGIEREQLQYAWRAKRSALGKRVDGTWLTEANTYRQHHPILKDVAF